MKHAIKADEEQRRAMKTQDKRAEDEQQRKMADEKQRKMDKEEELRRLDGAIITKKHDGTWKTPKSKTKVGDTNHKS